MSRSAAARTHHHDQRALRRPRPHGAAHARRVSGPAHAQAQTPTPTQAPAQMHAPGYAPPRVRVPARPPLRLAAGGAAIALRVADSAVNVSASRTMDRLVRSRAWVVIIGVGLIGIVAMQVSMLKLNSGIGRAVNTVATLERSNATLKGEVSELSSGDRIQSLAGARGFVMPEPADVTYLRAGDPRSDGFRAARRMGGADRAIAGPAGAVSATKLPETPATAPGDTGTPGAAATPAATAQSQTSAPATQPTTTPAPAASSTTPPATTAPAGTAPAGTGAGAAVSPAPAVPQTTSAGGVTPP